MQKTKSIARAITQFSRTDIAQLFKQAKTVFKARGIHLKRAPRLLDFGRILIVIPRKYGNAPARNKLRRQIRQIFYQEKFHEQPYDWILCAFSEAQALNFDELRSYLHKGLEKHESAQ